MKIPAHWKMMKPEYMYHNLKFWDLIFKIAVSLSKFLAHKLIGHNKMKWLSNIDNNETSIDLNLLPL